MVDLEKKEEISIQVIRTLYRRFENFPADAAENRNAPFHEAFLRAFTDKIEAYVNDVPYFISLSSWLHGLNTTLGQSFFENVAHILSDGQKRTFNEQITAEQKQTISEIITDLKNSNHTPNLDRENSLLSDFIGNDLVDALNFTADNIVEYNDSIEAIELKSVKPNAGEMRGEKQKILEGKAVLKRIFPDKEVQYYIGFPFDPLSDTATGSNKEVFMGSVIEFNKYFSQEEVLLSGELWDKLSGHEGTMQMILDIINSIATVEFMDNYHFINTHANYYTDSNRYKNILEKWNLRRELELLPKLINIDRDGLSKAHQRVFNNTIFNSDVKYNLTRYNKLCRLTSSD